MCKKDWCLMRYLAGVLAFGAYVIVTNLLFGYICPSMVLAGLPCPACGLTRAGLLFATGNFAESFGLHPLLIPAVVFIAVTVAMKFIKPNKIKVLQIPAIFLLICFIVLYIFRMVSLFPHHPPMVINSESILHNIINLIRERI